MLRFHKPITVTLEPKAFERMRNLKFLIVDNVFICEELEYLPKGLRLLHLPYYRFPLPSNFCPQKLVTLKMTGSRIRLKKLFKQVWFSLKTMFKILIQILLNIL
ncbi:hypothetical protein SO802_030089 [Lithocarpus litseifolius]|uniref:Uncharacterized protein n=1 Tax=Lithocarpus litseifolius TaxID=425828 RepID=A0AAW2C0K2_9ROSI